MLTVIKRPDYLIQVPGKNIDQLMADLDSAIHCSVVLKILIKNSGKEMCS